MTNKEIMEKFNISKSTFYDWLKRNYLKKSILKYLKKQKR